MEQLPEQHGKAIETNLGEQALAAAIDTAYDPPAEDTISAQEATLGTTIGSWDNVKKEGHYL